MLTPHLETIRKALQWFYDTAHDTDELARTEEALAACEAIAAIHQARQGTQHDWAYKGKATITDHGTGYLMLHLGDKYDAWPGIGECNIDIALQRPQNAQPTSTAQ